MIKEERNKSSNDSDWFLTIMIWQVFFSQLLTRAAILKMFKLIFLSGKIFVINEKSNLVTGLWLSSHKRTSAPGLNLPHYVVNRVACTWAIKPWSQF